jgi:LysM repeat protein
MLFLAAIILVTVPTPPLTNTETTPVLGPAASISSDAIISSTSPQRTSSGLASKVASTAQPSSSITASSTTVSSLVSSASSCYVAAPTSVTIPSGTTPHCYQWYVVQGGDTCDSITQALNLTVGTLYELNTELLPDCYNLVGG